MVSGKLRPNSLCANIITQKKNCVRSKGATPVFERSCFSDLINQDVIYLECCYFTSFSNLTLIAIIFWNAIIIWHSNPLIYHCDLVFKVIMITFIHKEKGYLYLFTINNAYKYTQLYFCDEIIVYCIWLSTLDTGNGRVGQVIDGIHFYSRYNFGWYHRGSFSHHFVNRK